jgi:hypothetical protein
LQRSVAHSSSSAFVLARDEHELRFLGLVLASCGWPCVWLSLTRDATGGYDKHREVLRLARSGVGGLIAHLICALLAVVSATRHPCGDVPSSDERSCAEPQWVGGVWLGSLCLWASYRLASTVFNVATVATTPRWLASKLWGCTRLVLAGALGACVCQAVARVARAHGGHSLVGADVLLVLLALCANGGAMPAARVRVLVYVWGIRFRSEHTEAAAMAVAMAGRIAHADDGSDVVAAERSATSERSATRARARSLLDDAKRSFRVLPFLKLSGLAPQSSDRRRFASRRRRSSVQRDSWCARSCRLGASRRQLVPKGRPPRPRGGHHRVFSRRVRRLHLAFVVRCGHSALGRAIGLGRRLPAHEPPCAAAVGRVRTSSALHAALRAALHAVPGAGCSRCSP